MNFSSVYSKRMDKAFSLYNNPYSDGSLDTSTSYNKFLTVTPSKEDFEIPSIIIPEAIPQILDAGRTHRSLVVPLFVGNTRSLEFKTADNLLRELMSVGMIPRLKKVETSKGDIYYGGKGLVFDRDFNPLVICTFIGHLDDGNNLSGNRLALTERIIHVSSRVFLNPDTLVNKSIIKKFIPYFLSDSSINSYEYPNGFEGLNTIFRSKPARVTIDNCDNLVNNSCPLVVSETSVNSNINKFLLENIDDIVDPDEA